MPEKPGYDGSTLLTSVFQETFVSNIIAGLVQNVAYQEAGYKADQNENSLNASASALLRNPNVSRRLAYKRALIAQNCEITEESQIKRFQELSRLAVDLNQISSAISAEDKIATICGLYEKDNKQKQGKSIVEILALVANSKRLEAPRTPVEALTAGEGTVEAPIAAEFEKENHEEV